MSFDENRLDFPAVRALLSARCVCDLGRRLVGQMRAASALAAITHQVELVREMMSLLQERLDPPIGDLRDVSAHLSKVARERAVLDPPELLDLKMFLETAGRMRHFFEQHQQEAPALHGLAMPLYHVPALVRSIEEKIGRDGSVLDSASETLAQLRSDIRGSETRITRELDRLVRSLSESGELQDDFFTLRNGRYVLPVKSDSRGKVKGIIHDSSNSGETVFIEPFVILEESNKLADLKLREREEVFRILLRVAGHVRDELSTLQTDAEILSEFDLVHAKARFGREFGCAFPSLTGDDRPLSLVEAHHPLLAANDRENSRPLNLALDVADRALVITGPNAGGKTTALKTVGLTVMMVQCAIPVPLSPKSHMPVYEDVLAAIGDDQSVLEGESTFSASMRRIVQILTSAGPRSLVLLDELGTATDPGEGGALAVAILESLVSRGTLTFVSTHLAVLKNWAEDYEGGRNASFRLDPRSHRPTFRLQLDVPGISEALVVAEQVGVPAEIVARARSLRPEKEYDASTLILSLEQKEQKLAEELQAAESARAELEAAQVEAGVLKQRLAEQRKKARAEAVAEKERAIADMKARFEALLARQPSKKELDDARRELEAMAADAAAERDAAARKEPDPGALRAGATVRVRSLNETGRVEEIIGKKGQVRVAVKGFHVTVKPDDLEVAGDEPEEDRGSRRAVHFARPANLEVSLDLHGMRVHEALRAVDQFMDRAMAGGLGFVRLVHGHGSGAIRRALHDHLRGHQLVKHYRHGSPAEGGGSVTIVDLK